ncbi:MAG: LicD family protein [Rikenellaceae bacterium]
MKELSLDQIREVQLNILRKVHDFCIENNIRYSLGGGTLLGAVRHQGYIPWDDDIDIMMPRADYDRFVELFSGSSDQYICACYENDPNYQYPFVKICDNRTQLKEEGIVDNIAVNIDLFPIDGLPSGKREIRSHVRAVHHAWRWVRRKNREIVKGRHSLLQRIVVAIIRRIPNSYFQEKIKALCYKYDYDKCQMAGAILGTYGMREVYSKELFESYTTLPFEGMELCSIADFDTYLSQHYGSYMELPPQEQQVRRHKVRAYALE